MGLTRIRAQQISNIDYKQAVRVVATTNVASLSGGAPLVVDGVTLVNNNRVLVAGQSNAAQNGLYRVQTAGTGSNGTWVRSSDGNQDGEMEAGMVVMVTEGTTYADKPWKLITNGPIVIGITEITFQQFATGPSAGGSNTEIQFNYVGNLAGSPNFTFDGSNVTILGNLVPGGIITLGNISGNYILGNGAYLTGLPEQYGNANVGNYLPTYSGGFPNLTGDVATTANISGNYFLGNGSELEGVPRTFFSNVAPANPEQGDIWIDSDTGVQVIYFNDGNSSQWAEMEAYQSFSSTTGAPGDYGNANVAAYLPTYTGNISAGNLTATGNISASYVLGNGALLTGISASGSSISNGTSNVNIASTNGNVTVAVNGNTMATFSTGGLAVAGNISGNGIPTTTVANLAPANAEQGDIWIDSDTGIQYIYFTTQGNSQWAEMEAYQAFSGGAYGNIQVADYLATNTGNISAGILTVAQGTHQQVQTKTGATGVVTHDCSLGYTFYHSAFSGNFTVNLTNLALSNNRSTEVDLVLIQGVAPGVANVVQIDGVAQTVNWAGGAAPTGTPSAKEMQTFNILNVANTYTILAQFTSFG